MKVWMICLFAIHFLDKFGNYLSEAKQSIRGLENRGGRDGPLTEAFAVVGGHVLLPCNMDPPVANDSTHLVLFYYGDAGTPIYSLDSRGSRLESATHWADSSVVSRAFVSTDPGQRGLLLEKVTLSDQGHYRCRVDFLESPTRNSRIKLTVVIPPKRLEIFSSIDTGRNLRGMVGPYTLGTEVVFTCKVTGGSPRPLVSWWKGETMVDNLSEVRKGDVTSNEIYQPPLTRYDFNKTLTCKASNSDLVEPLKSSISIDMTYPPTSILLAGGLNEVHLTEGETKRISCEVMGSRPPAKVIWRMGDQRLHSEDLGIQEEILRSGATRSYFTYLPRLIDDDEVLECSAYNPSMPKVILRNATKLAILYKPRMELRPESAFELDNLMEGSDVTLRCIVDANPAVTGVQWSHNGVPIQANSGHAVKVTQGTLTLRRISRFTSGNYTCAAANTEGGTTSNVLHLRVKFPPICTAGQQKLFGAAKHEELFVPCQVTAFPPPNSFRWAINTTRGMSDIHFAKATRTGSVSTLRYTAKTSLDFGELLCWATNVVATQRTPCVYKVIPAAKPHSVTECVADRNASMPASYVSVFCKEGWGGGLNQSFTLEVRQQATEEVLEKFSLASKPNFHISGLKLGVPYLLTVTAANSRGSSPPVTIPYTPPKASADKVISPVKEEPTTSNTPLILGIVGPLVGVAICIGVFVFIRNRGFFWGTTGQLKMAISRSFGNLQDLQELPSFGPRYKDKRASLASLDEMQINSNGPGSPISIYQRTGRMLNNSTTSLDNDVIFLRENQPKMPDYKAPLARADSIDSAASDMRTYYARASRPASFRSHCSAPLNPEQLLREEYLRRELARSMYLGDFLPPMPPVGGYLMSNHHLAKSDNLLRDTYVRNDFFEPYEYEVPPPYLETMATFRRQPKGKKADHSNLKSYGSMNIL